jgi:nitrite reductase (NADH) large subunit
MATKGRRTLVIAGHGMVGHKLVEELLDRGAAASWDIVVLCEERRMAYDRVHLSSFFTGASAEDLSLVDPELLDVPGLRIHIGDPAIQIDRDAKTVTSAMGRTIAYDALVLATGSIPFVPPVPGNDAEGCFVYRTIDDLEAIADFALMCRSGAVVGGGLLGLEAANALLSLGLETHVVEFAPRLMPVQVDEGGGAALRKRIEALGVQVHTGCQTSEITLGERGQVTGMQFADDSSGAAGLDVDLVVFSAGIRPRDDLARGCGLEVGERGGIVVDEACRTSDPSIYAIGECAVALGRTWGLVAPGYQMARLVADHVTESGTPTFTGADLSTKLKLLGIDVASFGALEGGTEVTYVDPIGDVYRKLIVDPHPAGSDGPRLLGGVLVGDASGYDTLLAMARGDLPTPREVAALAAPGGVPAAPSADALGDTALICSCNNVTKGDICQAVCDGATTKAGTTCGGCKPLVATITKAELRRLGAEVNDHLCEHFAHTRQELFDLVKIHGIETFGELVARHGRGRGCEICKPTVASILASIQNRHILDGEQATLQDTNDHFLANLQKDGTYSVVPRVPGGEITPEQLIAIGEVAREFGLYTKITGAQRIDLFGARVEQLPVVWQRLVDVGMESGHAYGKALRTVKSCVGLTWCRYGVQDSTTMAIVLEQRYRGLRAPHKLKMAVSGCTRECAEAQGKDVGVIATEKGWNLYVAGNGGMRPRHATLLATDLDDETLLRTIDRFLMFYVRTADRLERTSVWFEKLEGGIEHLRRVVFDDTLGLCKQFDADMAHHVATYECEWKATLESPERLARFRSFVNTDEPDPTVVFVRERGQIRPARADEKALMP